MHDGEHNGANDSAASAREVTVRAYDIGPRTPIEKANEQTSLEPTNDNSRINTVISDEIEPPYNPDQLCRLLEHSNSLRQNVDAYCTNIDGFGHAFDPVIQLKEAGSRDLVRDAIYTERYRAAEAGAPGAVVTVTMPTDIEVEQRIAELQFHMRMERSRVESFFENCVAEESFTSLRRRTRQDIEVTGNGYWEVIRSDAGELSQFVYIPARSVRLTSRQANSVSVPRTVREGSILFRQESFRRRFRRYVQVGGDRAVWFKEFGDPTVLSAHTGRAYETMEALRASEKDGEAANEVLHFRIHSVASSGYGVPRWIGNLLSVLGSRAAEEVNLMYFDNKAIPPLAVLVSGGRLGPESVKRIESHVEQRIKGRKNFHSILVIEAETSHGALGLGGDGAGTMKIEIKPLVEAQQKDGLFLDYDSANMDKVGMGFRLPRLLRGDIRDFNRASAEAALDFAEAQVFAPERNDFDFAMNRHILPALGIRYWQFKSNGPRLSDSQSWGEMIAKLTLAGVLTPEDARVLASTKVLSQDLPIIDADWVKQPLALTIAGVQLDNALDGTIPIGGVAPAVSNPAPQLVAAAAERLRVQARQLVRLRDAFRNQEAEEALLRFKQHRAEEDAETIRMPAKEMVEKFGLIPERADA